MTYTETSMGDPRRPILNPATARSFIFAGNAVVTLRSLKTGVRYTYRVTEAPKKNPSDVAAYFISLLTGANNENDYTYIGMARNDEFFTTRASKLPKDSAPLKAIGWTLSNLRKERIPDGLEIWHEGRCGRCGRRLSTTDSIEAGFGPECLEIVGFAAMLNIQPELPMKPAAPAPASKAPVKHDRKPAMSFTGNSTPDYVSVVGRTTAEPTDTEVEKMIAEKMETDPEGYWMDGEFEGTEADLHAFWFRRFKAMPLDRKGAA